MKYLTLLIAIALAPLFAYSQDAQTWNISKSDKGSVMTLTVPYNDMASGDENMIVSVVKEKGKDRPLSIAISVPNEIVKEMGVTFQVGKNTPRYLMIDGCESYCVVSIKDAYHQNRGETANTDVFKQILDNNEANIVYYYPTGAQKSIAISLSDLRAAYSKLD